MTRIRDSDAFEQCDVVETDFSGSVTRHIIVARYKTRSQSGVCYDVVPLVKGSGEGVRRGRLDHGWFKRVGRLKFDHTGKIEFVPDKF